MKPAWDQLASEFADSTKVLIADVDCTGEGEPICKRFNVEGFPTLKGFNPPDRDGDDYDGGRSFEELKEYAETLGPSCTAISKENCDAEQLAKLEEVMKTPSADLEAELESLQKQIHEAEDAHETLVDRLQEQYEDSQKSLEELRTSLKPRLKQLRAATAKSDAAQNKDEV